MTKMGRGAQVTAAGVIAAVAIACGEAAMQGTAGMMRDAGEWLADAGTALRDGGVAGAGAGEPASEPPGDAGGGLMDAMIDMGGAMLSDAGSMLSDAGAMLDAGSAPDAGRDGMVDSASAQGEACGSCTPGQRQMIVTADQDASQLRGGTVERGGWTLQRSSAVFDSPNCDEDVRGVVYTAELADGPLVLTDTYVNASTVQLFTVPAGQACYEEDTQAGPVPVNCPGTGTIIASLPALQRPTDSRSLFVAPDGFTLTGARIVIAPGETLCAIAGNATGLVESASPTSNARLLWSGFSPYE